MHRKRLLCWKAYLPRSSWPTQPTTPIICARRSRIDGKPRSEVGVAARQVRAEDWTLAEAELLDEQCEADRDLSARWPGGDMNRVAREAGDPVDSILRKGRIGKVNGKHQHHSGGETELPRLPS